MMRRLQNRRAMYKKKKESKQNQPQDLQMTMTLECVCFLEVGREEEGEEMRGGKIGGGEITVDTGQIRSGSTDSKANLNGIGIGIEWNWEIVQGNGQVS